MQRISIVFSLLLVSLLTIQPSTANDREADHEALRKIMKISSEALNSGNLDLLKPVLSAEHFSIVTVDSQRFDSLEAFSAYWNQLFVGENALLERIEVDPTADSETEFIAENVGVVGGTSTETYHFTDGDVIPMKTRWSAVTIKEGDDWKLARIHFSANILDNPLLDLAKQKMIQYVIIVFLAGLVLGLLLMGIIRRKKSTG